jgi:hypothetical protein
MINREIGHCFHVLSLFFLYEPLGMSLHPPPTFGGLIIYGAIGKKNPDPSVK